MSITNYITQSFQNSSNIVTSTSTVADNALLQISQSIAASATVVVDCPYIAANTTGIYVLCDQNSTTMTPSASGSAVLTFTDATVPFVWQINGNVTNPWAADFATLSVHNGSSTDAVNINIFIVSSGS